MTRKEKILQEIEKMSDADLLMIHNRYCMEVNYAEDCVYPMCEFDTVMQCESPLEQAFCMANGHFNPYHKYFYFNGYGNLESFNSTCDFGLLDVDEIAEYIDENGNSFGCEPIEEILIWEEK